MIFSFFRKLAKKAKETKEQYIPEQYRYAAACKKCGSVIWADIRDGRFWRVCNECKEGKKK